MERGKKVRNMLVMAAMAAAMVLPWGCSSRQAGMYSPMDYGGVGDGIADDTEAVQKAIDACSQAGGGTVLIPANHTFMCGPVELKSNIDLHLQPNSRLLANPNEEAYHLSAFLANEGEGMMWLHGADLTNLSITGAGTIDGNGISFMGAELDDSYELKPVTTFDPRPHVLTLVNVEKLQLRDVTIRNSAYWTVHLVGCNDASIVGITILNSVKVRNSDGIDLDHCKNVRIADCHIESGDDCICLKNRREYEAYGSCRDIVVDNCTMVSRSCAIKIGSENMDSIYNVLFNNCIVKDSNRGIGIQNRDEGTVTNVVFNNMLVQCHLYSDVWWGKSEPIYVTSYPRAVGNHKDAGWRFPKGATEGRCGEVSNIWFSNIKCVSENGIFVGADSVGRVNNVHFDRVNLDFVKVTDYPSGVYDRRPCVGEGFIADRIYAFYIERGQNIYIDDAKVSVGAGVDYAGNIKASDSKGIFEKNLLIK